MLSSTNAELSSRIEEAAVSETKARTELELTRRIFSSRRSVSQNLWTCAVRKKAKEGASSELASLQKKLRESERRQTHLMSRLHVEQRNRELTDGSHMKEEIKPSPKKTVGSLWKLRRICKVSATLLSAGCRVWGHDRKSVCPFFAAEQPLRPETVANGDGTSDLKRHLSRLSHLKCSA